MSENKEIINEIEQDINKLIDDSDTRPKESSTTLKQELLNKIMKLQQSNISDNLTESINQTSKNQLLDEKIDALSSQMEQTLQNINKLKKKHALKKRH